jgi:tRNA A-37 threonylcarbamoyl transferase component Bud32
MPVDPQPETNCTLELPADWPCAPPGGSAETPPGAVPATLMSESSGSAAPLAAPVNDPTRAVPATRMPGAAGGEDFVPIPKAALHGIDIEGYEIIEELGRGGMGVVYKARQVQVNRLVALKMILSSRHAGNEARKRFHIEAEAVARLQHPNIVQLYEVGEHEGHPFFSLEFCEDGTLAHHLKGEPISTERAARLVETMARAMHYAHERGVVHRDLKPANVLLDGAGNPKIADFGLAKRLDGDQGHTRTGEIMGTPEYMAPEQAAGRIKEIGPCTDIYALGAILYDMLTGRPPFQAPSVLEALELIRSQEPVPPSRLRLKLSRDLETICLKALQKEPRKRYASALEMAEDLKSFLAGEPIKARPVGTIKRAVRWCHRNRVVALLLMMLMVIFLSGVVFSVLVWRQSAQQYDEMAIQGVSIQAATLEQLREQYTSEVVSRAAIHGVPVRHDYREEKGAIPLPATLVKDLGERINKNRRGADVRLYSDYPFPWRVNSGPADDFEREALAELRKNPEEPYYRFAEMDGIPVLRYAVADLMKPACVNCHNTHPSSPKTDWTVGDVRGVLEIIRPLDEKVAQTRSRLRSLFIIPISIAVLAVAIAGIFSFTQRLQRNSLT